MVGSFAGALAAEEVSWESVECIEALVVVFEAHNSVMGLVVLVS